MAKYLGAALDIPTDRLILLSQAYVLTGVFATKEGERQCVNLARAVRMYAQVDEHELARDTLVTLHALVCQSAHSQAHVDAFKTAIDAVRRALR